MRHRATEDVVVPLLAHAVRERTRRAVAHGVVFQMGVAPVALHAFAHEHHAPERIAHRPGGRPRPAAYSFGAPSSRRSTSIAAVAATRPASSLAATRTEATSVRSEDEAEQGARTPRFRRDGFVANQVEGAPRGGDRLRPRSSQWPCAPKAGKLAATPPLASATTLVPFQSSVRTSPTPFRIATGRPTASWRCATPPARGRPRSAERRAADRRRARPAHA